MDCVSKGPTLAGQTHGTVSKAQAAIKPHSQWERHGLGADPQSEVELSGLRPRTSGKSPPEDLHT